jgi:hypothetical protein
VIPNPKMDAHSRALQNAAKRGKAREAQAKRTALSAARRAVQVLGEAHGAVDRVDKALRDVDRESETKLARVEAEATSAKNAHRRCGLSVKAAGIAAKHGKAGDAVKALHACEHAARQAIAAAKLAEQHAR